MNYNMEILIRETEHDYLMRQVKVIVENLKGKDRSQNPVHMKLLKEAVDRLSMHHGINTKIGWPSGNIDFILRGVK